MHAGDSGGGYHTNPGGCTKFPTAKFTTANLTWGAIPPPPPVRAGCWRCRRLSTACWLLAATLLPGCLLPVARWLLAASAGGCGGRAGSTHGVAGGALLCAPQCAALRLLLGPPIPAQPGPLDAAHAHRSGSGDLRNVAGPQCSWGTAFSGHSHRRAQRFRASCLRGIVGGVILAHTVRQHAVSQPTAPARSGSQHPHFCLGTHGRCTRCLGTHPDAVAHSATAFGASTSCGSAHGTPKLLHSGTAGLTVTINHSTGDGQRSRQHLLLLLGSGRWERAPTAEG